MLRFGRFVALLRIIDSSYVHWLSKNRVRGSKRSKSNLCVILRGVRGVCDSGTEPEHFVVEIEYLCVTSEDYLRGLNYGPNP